MKYTLSFQHRGEQSSTQLGRDGIYYVAFSSEGVHVFQNPTRVQHVIVIIERGSAFAVFDGDACALSFEKPYAFGDLMLSLKPDSAVHPQFAHFTKALGHRRRMLATVGAGIIVLIILIAFIAHLRIDGDEQITSAAMETVNADVRRLAPAQKNETTSLRFKLAKRALDEQQPHKAIEIIDKILVADAENIQAQQLKSRALELLDGATRENKLKLSRDLWAQQMISEASRIMAEGDYVGARFTLRQILDIDPTNARAIEMMHKIDGHLQALTADSASDAETRTVATANAQELFENGRIFKDKGNTVEAYQAFKGAVDILRKHDVHPDFEVLLSEHYEETRDHVAKKAEGLIATAQENYQRGNKSSGATVRTQHYRKAMDAVRDAEAMYEEVDVKGLRQDILSGFSEALEPLYVEAITLQELEGCCFANAKLMEIKRLAQFPEVHHYEASVTAMNRCPCMR